MEFLTVRALITLTILLQATGFVHSDEGIISCQDTSFERGSRAKVGCEYPLDFIAVFWYRGDVENPFLRLEGGRTSTEEGFGISPSGEMIINNIQITHEGSYKISVLDANGVSNSAFMFISVTVSLAAEPLIQPCASSESKICNDFAEEERWNILICESKGTRPAVDFVWSVLVANNDVVVNSSLATNVINTTTGLYSSFSTLRFNPHDISLQLFTCNATGKAVNTSKVSSLLVTGSKDVLIKGQSSKMIIQGSSIDINCPKTNFALGALNVTYTDGTSRTLAKGYFNSFDEFCQPSSKCTFSDKGKITINYLTFQDEGKYECVYSDGEEDGKSLTIINTLTTPNPEEVLIEGCEDSSRCEKNVDLKGTLTSSILGARPRAKIVCEVDKQTALAAFLYNEQTVTEEHSEDGTFDTIYTVEYKIPECSKPVHIMCYTESVHVDLPDANVYLVTDPSLCKTGKPAGITVLLVLLLLMLVGIIVGIGIFFRKKILVAFQRICDRGTNNKSVNINSDMNITSEGSPEMKELLSKKTHQCEMSSGSKDKSSDNTKVEGSEASEGNKDNSHDSEQVESLQTFPPETKEKLHDSEQARFKDIFYPFIAKVVQGEGTSEEFRSIAETCSKEMEVKHFLPLLSNFLINDIDTDKDMTTIAEFFYGITPNHWIPLFDFLKIIADLAKSKKLLGDRALQFFEDYTMNGKINLDLYVDLSGSLLTSHCISPNLLLTTFRRIVATGVFQMTTMAKGFLRYYLLEYVTEKDAVAEICSFPKDSTIPPVYFLQSTYLQYCEERHVQYRPNLFTMFQKLLERMSTGDNPMKLFHHSNPKKKIKQSTAPEVIQHFLEQSVDYQNQDLCSIYVQVLICSVETKEDMQTCKEMMEVALKMRMLSSEGFSDAFKTCIKNKWLVVSFQIEILCYSLERNMMPDESHRHECFQVLLRESGVESFWNCLQLCLKKRLIPDETHKRKCFQILLEESGVRPLLGCLQSCLKKNLITDGLLTDIVYENIRNNKIEEGEFNEALKELQRSKKMTKQDAEKLMDGVHAAAKKDPRMKASTKGVFVWKKPSFPKTIEQNDGGNKDKKGHRKK